MEKHLFAWMMDIFFIFTLHILYSRLLGAKYKGRWTLALGWTGCFVLWNLSSYFLVDNMYLICLNTCLVNFLVLVLLYEGTVWTKLILFVTVMVSGVVSEGIILFLIPKFLIPGGISGDSDLYVASAFSKLVWFLFVKIISEISGKRKQIRIQAADWVEVFLVPGGSILICYMLWCDQKRSVDAQQLVIIGVLLVINLATYFLYQKIQKNAHEKLNSELLQQQNEYFRIRYEEFQNQWKKIRRLKHDMKNGYALEMSYLERGEYETLFQYYQEKLGQMNSREELLDTGNIGIDSIISYKLEQAKECGIEVEEKIGITGTVTICDADLNIIIGNLFDNAIEAVRELDAEKRRIGLRVKTDQTALYLELENSYCGNRQKDGEGNYLTLKKDKISHGIGLREVKELVRKYQGTVDIEDSGDFFRVRLLMYMN